MYILFLQPFAICKINKKNLPIINEKNLIETWGLMFSEHLPFSLPNDTLKFFFVITQKVDDNFFLSCR